VFNPEKMARVIPLFGHGKPSGRIDLVREGNTVRATTRAAWRPLHCWRRPMPSIFPHPSIIADGRTVFSARLERRVATLMKWAAIDNDRIDATAPKSMCGSTWTPNPSAAGQASRARLRLRGGAGTGDPGLSMMTRACLRPAPDVPHLPSIFLERGERKTIGRSPQADVVLDEPSLSRLHAAVSMSREGELSVEDLGSTNGVFVNHARQKEGPLAVGDRVMFGILEYLVQEAPEHPILDTEESTILRLVKLDEPQKHIDVIAMEGLLATSRGLMGFTDLKGLLERVLDRLQPVLKPDRSAICLRRRQRRSDDACVRPDGAYTSVSDFASSTIVRESIRRLEVIEVCDAALDARLQDAVSRRAPASGPPSACR
jgi:hypothetical protein